MIITVNDIQKEFLSELTIEELVRELKIATNGIAIAVNSTIVKRKDWSSNTLLDKDNVLIIKSTQGG